jgi:hypothetical protein
VKVLSIGEVQYRLVADERGDHWSARAERDDGGQRFGPEIAGATEGEAIDGLTGWLLWQNEHAGALAMLQDAERVYHRTIAGSAFANPTEGPTPIELQKDALDALEAARIRLDEVRARKPE